MNYPDLSAAQIDALRDISNLGMGHAATALSQLLGETVLLQVPRINVTDVTAVPDLLGGAENVVVGITLKILGDAQGSILLIFPRSSASRLLERLLGEPEDGPELSEMGASTLKEIANILASAYLSALGGSLELSLIPSIPALACDMAGAVIDYALIDLSRSSDLTLLLETEFCSGQSQAIRGDFFVLPTPESLELILRAAGERR